LLLEVELQSAAQRLDSLANRALSDGLSRYAYLAIIVELSSTIARLRGLSPDSVFEVLSTTSKTRLKDIVDSFLDSNLMEAA